MVLGLRSLAANLSLDPKWILNRAELSRVPWRHGMTEEELVVEVIPFEGIDRGQIPDASSDLSLRVADSRPSTRRKTADLESDDRAMEMEKMASTSHSLSTQSENQNASGHLEGGSRFDLEADMALRLFAFH